MTGRAGCVRWNRRPVTDDLSGPEIERRLLAGSVNSIPGEADPAGAHKLWNFERTTLAREARRCQLTRVDSKASVAERRFTARIQACTIGTLGRVPGTRELIVAKTRYLVPYRVRGETVEILRVFHTSRRLPERW